MKKKLIRTVDLRFFQDDANGKWGVTHKETCPGNGNGEEFNAFWDGRGLFHDVFEHAHEFTDRYFRKWPYVLTTAGETVAMGALLYYIGKCGVNRDPNSKGGYYYTPEQQAVLETCGTHCEIIKSGQGSFAGPLEVCVPNQKDTGDSMLEWAIDEHWQKVLEAKQKVASEVYKGSPDETERAKEFSDSVTEKKIRNLYRYGFHMAEKLAGNSRQNGTILSDFVLFWDDFCKRNSAEELAGFYKGIVFRIYKDAEGIISWVATFEPKPAPSYEAAKRFKLSGGDENPRVPFVADEFFPRGEE
jgi:hypothetical protein